MSETASGSDTGTIEISIQDGIQILRMARSEKKNALTQSMYAGLFEALVSGDRNPDVRVHVVLGGEGAFSSGNDIADFLAHTSGGRHINSDAPVLKFVSYLPEIAKPVVAGVDGLAIGIGTTMLFHFDLVYATPQSVFHTPFVDLGLVPEAASSFLMPQRMGYARAFEMLGLGQPKTADHMREYGLVNSVVPSHDLDQIALKAAAHLAAKPEAALRVARTLMRGDVTTIRAQMREEIEAFIERLSSAEARTAFEAFLFKTKSNHG